MMRKQLIGLSLFVATASAVVLYPAFNSDALPLLKRNSASLDPVSVNATGHRVAARPKIDVVFALDTTGSMGGLIAAAKENIWSIATSMAQADPAPDIRIGLVAYRDRGDEYVTKVIDLSDDLDSMYAELMDLNAAGGGDGPESVNKALADAVQEISWNEDSNTYRVIFLVGDAPPHMDYANELKYPQIIAQANQRGIVVNTIRCGHDQATEQAWQAIAGLSQGEFFNVAQSGNAVAVVTPFDASIAELSSKLDDTRMVFGDEADMQRYAAKQKATDKLHAEASLAVRAKRAAFNSSDAGKYNAIGDQDLVEAVTSGRVDLASIAPQKLPQPLRDLSPAERENVVKEEARKRQSLSAEIARLAQQRDQFIAAEVAADGGADDSLDNKIYAAVKQQAAEVGLSYEGDAKY